MQFFGLGCPDDRERNQDRSGAKLSRKGVESRAAPLGPGIIRMSHADQLIEVATELAMDAKDNVADLRHKLSAIETAKVEIEARLHNLNHALKRLSSFVSIRGSDVQCPVAG